MKDVTIRADFSIRQAMKKLSQTGEKCLVIVDEKNTLLGTLSDGDLRKAILNGSENNEKDKIENNIKENKSSVKDTRIKALLEEDMTSLKSAKKKQKRLLVFSQLKILMPVGTATSMVVSITTKRSSGDIPLVSMWCP